MGDQVVPYAGEFLVSPAATELSLNWCSHDCSYCFANLNQPKRRADYKAIMGLLSEFRTRTTSEAIYLQQGFPTLISNRVDPFAKSNARLALPIIETMAELGLPMAFQTKGGEGVDDVLEWVSPSVWYISISFWDDSKRQRVEPAAPSVSERLGLIEKLVERGHCVTVGINPCDPDWLPWDEAEQLVAALAARGVWGVWLEALHFNRQQLAKLSPSRQEAMGADVVERARRQHLPEALVMEHLRRVYRHVADLGMQPYSNVIDSRTGFFDPWYELYPRALPTWQLLVNACIDAGVQPEQLLSYEDAMQLMRPFFPEGQNYYYVLGYERYQVVRELLAARGDRCHRFSLEEAMSPIWGDKRITKGPTQIAAFAYACEREGKDIYPLVDEHGRPYLQFRLEGWPYYFASAI